TADVDLGCRGREVGDRRARAVKKSRGAVYVPNTVFVRVNIDDPAAESWLGGVLFTIAIEVVELLALNRPMLRDGDPVAEVDIARRRTGSQRDRWRRPGLVPSGLDLLLAEVLAHVVLPSGQIGERVVTVGIGDSEGLEEHARELHRNAPSIEGA